MSLIISGMDLPKHAAVNGDKDTAYRCVILAHSDNTVELVIDTEFASPYDNGHNIQRYPLTEVPTPHGRLIDADALQEEADSQPCFWKGAIDELMVRNAPTIIEAELESESKKYAEIGRKAMEGFKNGIKSVETEASE